MERKRADWKKTAKEKDCTHRTARIIISVLHGKEFPAEGIDGSGAYTLRLHDTRQSMKETIGRALSFVYYTTARHTQRGVRGHLQRRARFGAILTPNGAGKRIEARRAMCWEEHHKEESSPT